MALIKPPTLLAISAAILIGIAGASLVHSASKSSAGAAAVDYERDIKPIFAESCLACHGPDKAKGGVKLTDRNSAMSRSKKGNPPIVPGKPEESELIRRVTSTDEDKRMPPLEGNHEPLKATEIDKLTRWIAQGAPWSDHWAFKPIAAPVLPEVKNKSWIRNPIDQFILAKLEGKSIAPSPEADRHTQIKRLYYDLIGLPPSIKEVDAFVADPSPDAYGKVVDRLLASEHYGERWGRHWLDMARYADSDGYEKDRARPDAYTFRDWVINAFNDDMPFNQFTLEQIAGDLLPNAKPSQKVATAFNRQTLTNEEGGVDQEEYRVAAVMDRTETLGTVWLGLTIGCARCHNHKYDPISQADYYSLFAFFNDADEATAKLPVSAADLDAMEAKLQPLEAAMARRRRELAPAQRQWEIDQRAIVLENKKQGDSKNVSPDLTAHALRDVKIASDNAATRFVKQSDDSHLAAGPSKDKETYTLTASVDVAKITGFKLEVTPDQHLPGRKTVGRSKGGNFVLSTFKVEVIDAKGAAKAVELQQPSADFEQKTFGAAKVNAATSADGKPTGWGVSGQVDQPHWIQFRTSEPVNPEGRTIQLRVTMAQNYGTQHTVGRIRLVALTGDDLGVTLPKDVVNILEMYPEKRVASNKLRLFDFYAGKDEQVRSINKQIDAVYKQYNAKLMDVRVIGTALRPRTSHIFERGSFLSPAAQVAPATPAILPKPAHAENGRMTRLDLARWLVAPENPLVRRVAVNHVWNYLMGDGLMRTINDFGVRGDVPIYCDLLDYLSGQFAKQGWSHKKLIKLIVTSAVYRQSSAARPDLVDVDPLNTLMARQNRFRVEGEIVRDLNLAAGGILSPKVGGPSVYPPMPPDIAKLSYANNFKWTDSTGEDRYRRGMYTFFKRTAPHPTLMTFDCPDANVACVDRNISDTPLQALTLLNNETFHESAQAMARRILTEAASMSEEERLAFALRLCVGRPAKGTEVATLAKALSDARGYYAENHEQARQLVGQLGPREVESPEGAAWVAVARIVLNLDEFMTRE